MNKQEIYKAFLEHFGEEHQLRKLQEELAEGIQAINKYLTGSGKENLFEEIADIEILIEQIYSFIPGSKYEIDEWYHCKLNRMRVMAKDGFKPFKPHLLNKLKDIANEKFAPIMTIREIMEDEE